MGARVVRKGIKGKKAKRGRRKKDPAGSLGKEESKKTFIRRKTNAPHSKED